MYTQEELLKLVLELKEKAYLLQDLLEDMEERNKVNERDMTNEELLYLTKKLYVLVQEILSYKSVLPEDHTLFDKCESIKKECEEILEDDGISQQEINIHKEWVNSKN